MRHRRPGVTFQQLVVVLALAVTALAFVLPGLLRLRAAADLKQSQNNLRLLGIASHSAHDVYGVWPPSAGVFQGKTGSLHYFLLPFIERNDLFANSGNAVWINDAWSTPIETLTDPDDPSVGPKHVFEGWLATTSYPCNYRVFREGQARIANITDGTSNTLMFAQRYQLCNGTPTAWGYPALTPWAPVFALDNVARFQVAPKRADCDPARPQSYGGAIVVALCDGSSRTVAATVNPLSWGHFCEPADGNAPGDDL